MVGRSGNKDIRHLELHKTPQYVLAHYAMVNTCHFQPFPLRSLVYVRSSGTKVNCNTTTHRTETEQKPSHCCPPLEVLLDLSSILVVEPCGLLVELHVPFIDIVHISLLVEGTTTTELGTLLNPRGEKIWTSLYAPPFSHLTLKCSAK